MICKKKVKKDEKLFDREKRELIKERKYAKTKLSWKQVSPQSNRNLNCEIGKLDRKLMPRWQSFTLIWLSKK